MTTDGDHECLVKALRKLVPSVRPSADRAWRRAPAVRVIDCILSLNRNYDRFVVPRLDQFERNYPEIWSIPELSAKIATYLSVHEFVIETLAYRHEERAITLGKVASWLTTVSGDGTRDAQLDQLESWAGASPCDGYLALGIRGFGLAGFQYLRMLFGANTTKPDRLICALRLLERAAPEANVYLRDVDTTIWEMLARGSNHYVCVA